MKILLIFLYIASFTAVADTPVKYVSDGAEQIMASLQNKNNVIYINSNFFLTNNRELSNISLGEIKRNVVDNNKSYIIDYSVINNNKQKQLAKNKMNSLVGVSFDGDFLYISELDGKILYTPLINGEDPVINTLKKKVHIQKDIRQARQKPQSNGLPILSFFVNTYRPISLSECKFPLVQKWSSSEQGTFCDNPNISLIYSVELMRSRPIHINGGTSPDQKIVRISLAGASRGSGIHLNDKITNTVRWRPDNGSVFDGWVAQYINDAIALDYGVKISASNGKATIVKKSPSTNVQSNYQHIDTEGFQVGGTAGVEVDKTGPKGKLEVSASYNVSQTLKYNTTDYRIDISTPDDDTFDISWVREQYRNPDDLLNKKTEDLITNASNPVNLSLIKPISYRNFTPQMEVFYGANPDETGATSFTIDSSVTFSPIYYGIYRHYIFFGAWRSYQGGAYKPKHISALKTFTINWDHPIFIGGRPVNIQLGGTQNKCIAADSNGTIHTDQCNNTDYDQSFVRDEYDRYLAASNTSKCLDGHDLTKLADCNFSLSQRWEWSTESDMLKNNYKGTNLTHDVNTSQLSLSKTDYSSSHYDV